MKDCKCKGDKTHWFYPCGDCYQQQLRERCARTEAPWEDLASQLSRSGLPPQAVGELSRPLGLTEAMTEARSFFAQGFATAPGMGLLGKAGRGKTVAAGWLMLQVLKDKGWNNVPTGELSTPVLCVEAHRLTGIHERDKLDADWLHDLRRVLFLVLDDMGDEGTPAGVSALAGVIKARHGSGRRTVLTSNLHRDAFLRRYGEAIADRIRLVELGPGKSMRQARPEVRR